MVRYRLRELMAEKQFHVGKRVSIGDVAAGTGIHRTTLSKMINQRGLSTTTELLEKLCRYFNVGIGDLVEIVPDEKPKKPSAKARRKR